jgi:hypothetical protein
MKQETDPRLKLNLDGIYLDMDDLLKKYDCKMHSCSEGKEIQQIALFCQQNINDYRKPVLMDMINPKFSFAGLYPHVMKSFDKESFTKAQKDFIVKLYDERKKKRNIISIDTPSELIPIYVDEETASCHDLPNHVRIWNFECPICETELDLDDKLMTSDEHLESSWIGKCPSCKVKMVFHRPD